MANIKKELEEIDKNQYGRDIRWPIYFALLKMSKMDIAPYYVVDNRDDFMISSEGVFITAKE